MWVNWDVDELKAMKGKIDQPHQLSITMNGWPFGDGGDGSKDALKF